MLLNEDVILVSTFLDPRLGIFSFEDDKKDMIKERVKALLVKQLGRTALNIVGHLNEKIRKNEKESIFSFYGEEEEEIAVLEKDPTITIVNDYIKLSNASRRALPNDLCPLAFWKDHEYKFPELAAIARKFLSVQASSAAFERMFSIAGIIQNAKRRSMSAVMFCKLVNLKLNEKFF